MNASYNELGPPVGRLVAVAAQRLEEEATVTELTTQLSAIAQRRKIAEQHAVSAAGQASAVVQSLRSQQLDEIRSLQDPPRAVSESIGLLSLLLRPGDFVDSVESISWAQAVSVLDTEIQDSIQRFEVVDVTGVLLSVPAVRQILDLLDNEDSRPTSCSSNQPLRGSRPSSRGCAEGAVAQLLAGTPTSARSGAAGSSGSMSLRRGRSIVCASHDEPELDVFGGNGLLDVLRGDADFGVSEIVAFSPPAGALLTWALCQLRCLRAQLPSRAGAANAVEGRLRHARQEALVRVAALTHAETAALQEVLTAFCSFGADDAGEPGPMPPLAEVAVSFSKGSSLMSSLASRPLYPTLCALRGDPRLRVVVDGYANAEEGVVVATRRAETIAKYFGNQGIAPHRVHCLAAVSSLADGTDTLPAKGIAQVRVLTATPLLAPGCLWFAPSSEELNEETRTVLDGIAGLLRQVSCIHLEVEGHMEDAPSPPSNDVLSAGRTRSVVDYLENKGVPKAHIAHVGLADSQPVATNEHPRGRDGDSRLELWAHAVPQERPPHPLQPALRLLTLLAARAVALHGCAPLSAFAGSALGALGLPWGPRLAQAALPRGMHA